MSIKCEGNPMCAQHEKDNETRIPCPLDPKHSIHKDSLERHLKICNATKLLQNPPSKGFKENVNISLSDFEGNVNGKRGDIFTFIISTMHRRHCDKWSAGEPASLQKGKATRHHLQNELLSSHLLNGIEGDFVFIEMGAGKGGLSRSLVGVSVAGTGFDGVFNSKSIKEGNVIMESCETKSKARKLSERAKASKIFLIDRRKNFRSKGDSFLRKTGHDFERLFMDIKDVDLDSIIPSGCKNVIIAGKHLCGGATCLTINALERLLNCRKERGEKGLKIRFGVATCCHQLCSWDYFSAGASNILKEDGISKEDFEKIKKTSSWAVCKYRLPYNLFQNNINISSEEWELKDGIGAEEYGFACKTYIDDIRCSKLEEMGFTVERKEYCHSGISLENKIIIGDIDC